MMMSLGVFKVSAGLGNLCIEIGFELTRGKLYNDLALCSQADKSTYSEHLLVEDGPYEVISLYQTLWCGYAFDGWVFIKFFLVSARALHSMGSPNKPFPILNSS